MNEIHSAADSQDTEILGASERRLVVRADDLDARGWLRGELVCGFLAEHQISHCGVMEAVAPFELVRVNQSGTFLLACIEGEGRILADGTWKSIRAGEASMLPPFVTNALKCVPGKCWTYVWVRYRESRESRPMLSSLTPVSGAFDGGPLRAAVEGLHAECVSARPTATILHHWSELVHRYVMKFGGPHRGDERLRKTWQRVEAELARPWTLDELAALACVSAEHLRRLCRQELGRSPMRHLTYLRLQRARHLLSATDDKIEVIAREVGFESLPSFSNTFRRWIGRRPSAFRGA